MVWIIMHLFLEVLNTTPNEENEGCINEKNLWGKIIFIILPFVLHYEHR
jgi:hypothetical protein